jgi:hypothetical protein
MEPLTVDNRVAATANTAMLASGCGRRYRIRPLFLGLFVHLLIHCKTSMGASANTARTVTVFVAGGEAERSLR